MYKIGDRVVYPMQGAGTIVDKETKELLGMEKEFFILQMPIANIRISIPVDQMEKNRHPSGDEPRRRTKSDGDSTPRFDKNVG